MNRRPTTTNSSSPNGLGKDAALLGPIILVRRELDLLTAKPLTITATPRPTMMILSAKRGIPSASPKYRISKPTAVNHRRPNHLGIGFVRSEMPNPPG